MMVAAAFQYMQKTRHIAVDVGLRMCEAITYSGLCSQVDYRIEGPGSEKCVEGRFVTEVHLPERIIGVKGRAVFLFLTGKIDSACF